MNTTEYRLGQIDGRLAAIERRLDEGAARHKGMDERHDEIDGRLDRLELIEARRAGVIAAITAVAGLIGGLIVAFVKKLI